MASTKPDVVDDETAGPSVDSPLAEVRIAARRKRIAKRLEAMKNVELGNHDNRNSPTEPEGELSKSKNQIETSYQRLSKLITDGTELVSNVEVACDAREVNIRNEEHKNRRMRIAKLEEESNVAAKQFEEITKKWENSVKVDCPQALHKLLLHQKEHCDAMVAEKVKLINYLQNELKTKDDQYVKDLRKQAEDADLLIERMDELRKELVKAYDEELQAIETAYVSERKDLLGQQKKIWESQSEARRKREIEYMELRQSRVDEFEVQLQSLRVQDAEEYNMVKIKLEKDVQTLEQNLQQMKATYQLNQEKLEYNFQVLKKRDEENTITKSQQKRKITRLQDLLNNLKQKLRRQEQAYCDENQTLSDDLKRMTEQYKELQKKFRHFQATDRKKFDDIWKMNEEQIKELVTDVLSEDSIIFEQQLGLTWEAPDLEFLKNVGPIKITNKPVSALETAQSALTTTNSDMSDHSLTEDHMTSQDNMTSEDNLLDGSGGHTTSEENVLHDISLVGGTAEKLTSMEIKKMLELLCDEAGFLVEAKLIKLLVPIEKDEQSLMKLDAIFNAVGIESEEDILLLAKYLYKPASLTVEVSTEDLEDKPTTECFEAIDTTGVRQELISANDVVKALRQFIEDNNEPSSKKPVSRFGSCINRDTSSDAKYWSQLASVINEKKEKVWDALIEEFDKYYQVLVERSTLIQETDGLRQQNGELRLLLHQYLNSKVNQELEIPPTRVLQMELAHNSMLNNNY